MLLISALSTNPSSILTSFGQHPLCDFFGQNIYIQPYHAQGMPHDSIGMGFQRGGKMGGQRSIC